MSFRPTVAIVDLAQVRRNFHAIGFHNQTKFICPMVKANAYGHGDVAVANCLRAAGAKWLGVALVEEGLQLRAAGDREAILVFAPFDRAAAKAMLEAKLTPVVSDFAQLEMLHALDANIAVHLEVNSGMNRLGLEAGEGERIARWFEQHSRVRLAGIGTHLLRGSDAGLAGGETDLQMKRFSQFLLSFSALINSKKLFIHVYNSSGLANVSERLTRARATAVSGLEKIGCRPGIALYGVEQKTVDLGLLGVKPALTWRTQVAALHKVAAGEAVSYDAKWRAGRSSVIAVVPVGYADGYRRALSNRGEVLWRGHRVPVVGTVCMDYFMIDLTQPLLAGADEAVVGDEIILLGRQANEIISVEELAEKCATISYEIFTGIGARVPRLYTGKEETSKEGAA